MTTTTNGDVVRNVVHTSGDSIVISDAPARVTREPRTYEKHKPDSFFADLIRSNAGSQEARARLARHQREMEVEKRVQLNFTAGTGGEFVPPIWAIDQFATVARAGRVVADLVPNLPLGKGQSVNIPTITAGADTAPQTAQGQPAAEVDQVTSSQASVVVTIAGTVDASQQILDQTPPPGYDGIVYVDLMRSYNADLEYQLINGSGVNGQLYGLLNTTGRVTDTAYTDASPTVPELFVALGKAYAVQSWTRQLAPEVLLLHPRRWAWIASQADTATRPFVTPGEDDKNILATPVAETTGIDVGAAGATADVAIFYRPSDALLYESVDHFSVMGNPLSGTLQTRLQMRRYVAFVNRYPTAIAAVSGTGMAAPSGY